MLSHKAKLSGGVTRDAFTKELKAFVREDLTRAEIDQVFKGGALQYGSGVTTDLSARISGSLSTSSVAIDW
jgi:hypothetical protein